MPPIAFLTEDHLWIECRPPCLPSAVPRPALFLDRDGVIVAEVNYLRRVEDVRLLPGAAALIGWANRAGIPVVVPTNQAGIARGLFGWRELAAVQTRMAELLAAEGAAVDLTIACPHHPDGRSPFAHPDHPMRKPNPGMLRKAARMLGLDLGRSVLVGDKATDLEAGLRAGLAAVVHVLTGHGAPERATAANLAADRAARLLIDDLTAGGEPIKTLFSAP